jgi:hypothetical protein
MSTAANLNPCRAELGPAARWVVWLLLQAMLALLLSAGPRAIAGPLHWHADTGHHPAHSHAHDHPHGELAGTVARHSHEPAADLVLLEPGSSVADDLRNAGAAAAAALWPAMHGGLGVPALEPEGRLAALPALPWADADSAVPEHRPRG